MSLYGPITDGLNDQITFEELTTSNNTNITIKVKFTSIKAGGLLSNGGLTNYLRLGSTGKLRVRTLGNSALSEWTRVLAPDVWYVIAIQLRPTAVRLDIDGQYVGNSGGAVTGFTINRAGMFNTTDFLPAVFEFIKIDDLNTPANNRHWINEVSAGASLDWPDISGNAKPATLTNTPTDGTQWATLIGAVLTPITNLISTVTGFRGFVGQASTLGTAFRTSLTRLQDVPATFRANLSTLKALTTQFTQNAALQAIQVTKALSVQFRREVSKAVPLASAMRSSTSTNKPLAMTFRSSLVALALSTALFRRGVNRAQSLTAQLNGETLIDWAAPAKRLALPLTAENHAFSFNKQAISLNLSVNRAQL